MDVQQVRENMMSLWKETFGDSSEYISLVFNNYFNPKFISFFEEGGVVKSSLMGIPYDFVSKTGRTLQGLYLCGLATKKDSRRRGIMTRLLDQINIKAEEEGFDFTFLIPSGEGIRRYYRDCGYQDAFYLKKEYYVRGHDFKSDIKLSCSRYDFERKNQITDFLCKYGTSVFNRDSAYILAHSRKDWEIVLDETLISNGHVFIGQSENSICAVAFAEVSEREIAIKKLIVSDSEFKNALLKCLSSEYGGHNITLVKDLEEIIEGGVSNQLWSPFYAQNNGKKAEYEDIAVIVEPFNESLNAYSFGMINIFDIKKLLIKAGIDNLDSLNTYSEEEIKQLVLRKPVGSNGDALENVLNLPEINFSMSLMLE